MKTNILFSGLLYLISIAAVFAQQPTLEWAQRYDGKDASNDKAVAIAVDAQGNSYVTGTSFGVGNAFNFATIRYDAATGAQTWVQQHNGSASDIATDNTGGIYVISTSLSKSTTSFNIAITRYDAATGKQTWTQQESPTNNDINTATAMAVDNTGGVYVAYVTGFVQEQSTSTVFNVIRYNAASGMRTWVESYEWIGGGIGEYDFMDLELTIAMAVDSAGGLYLTGSLHNAWYTNFATMRCDAATGKQTWAEQYSKGDTPYAIAVDNAGGVYVTGSSQGEDYATVRYDAATGKQTWVQQYDGPTNSRDVASAIAIDNFGGIYVTGSSYGENYNDEFATIRYDAATGKQLWVQRYNGLASGLDYSPAIAVDPAGSVYVTGSSYGENRSLDLATIRYDAATGEQMWVELYDRAGESQSLSFYERVDMALDGAGNIFIAGSDYSTETGLDYLTLKYSQCTDLPTATVAGSPTTNVNSNNVTYSLAMPGANSFAWNITDSDGNAHTDFIGQGTSSISVNWPAQPNAYKISVSYGKSASCPVTTAVRYVHVSDPAAGFVIGGGWSDSPADSTYELMHAAGKAYWGFAAKYQKKDDSYLPGTMLLLVESGSHVFRSSGLEQGSLVVTGNRAYFRGHGTLTRLQNAGIKTDERRFGFLVAATDGQSGTDTGPDMLRIKVWVINADGAAGRVIFDNQAGCPLASMDENAAPCSTLDKGAIVIYQQGKESNLLAAATDSATLEAYPTTFSNRTTIAFTSENDAAYSLDLYDLKGTLVQRIAAGTAVTGKRYAHELEAARITKGLYLVRLTTSGKVETVKLVVQK